MRSFVSAVPFFLPVFALSILLALVGARRLAKQFRTRPIVAFALVGAIGLIVAATLTPSLPPSGARGADGPCDLGRIGFASVGTYLQLNEASLNVLLFIPLGIALGLLPASHTRKLLFLGAVLVPFAVELTQSVAVPLGRGCESADVFDNLLGLALGGVIGLVAGVAGRIIARGRIRL